MTDVLQVTETDLAQPVGRRKSKAVNQVTLTNTSQAVGRRKSKAAGQSTETDLAQTFTILRSYPVGQVVETDAAGTTTKQVSATEALAVGGDVATDRVTLDLVGPLVAPIDVEVTAGALLTYEADIASGHTVTITTYPDWAAEDNGTDVLRYVRRHQAGTLLRLAPDETFTITAAGGSGTVDVAATMAVL